jgi:preprotein translocase SecE subunit
MEEYKPGQGSMTRLAAWLVLILVLALGAVELYSWIQRKGDGAVLGLSWELFRTLPFLGVPLSWKLLLCIVIFGGLLWFMRMYMTRATTVDMLIETELEMKKVSWPTFEESMNATWVVLLVTVTLTIALFFFDFVLGSFFRFIF